MLDETGGVKGRWGRRVSGGGGGKKGEGPVASPVATSEGVLVQGTLSAALCHFNPANY